jgi:hypothetical protein
MRTVSLGRTFHSQCGDTAQQRRMNDHFPERVDRGHVERGEGPTSPT